MPFDVVSDVSFEKHFVYAVRCNCAIVRMVNGAVTNVRPIHHVAKMKVNSVSTQPKRLTSLANLHVLEPSEKKTR